MVHVGIIGASGYTGAELLRLCAQHPEFEVVYATGDTQAGTRAASLYPSLAGRYPTLMFEEFEIERGRARPGLPRPSARGKPGAGATVGGPCRLRGRPLGRVSTARRIVVPAVVRLRARSAGAARASGVRAPGTAPWRAERRSPGGHTGLPRHCCHAGVGAAGERRAHRAHRGRGRQHHRRQRRGAGTEAHVAVLHRRRGCHCLRPAGSSPHSRDRAGGRGTGAVHAPSRSPQSRPAGNVLRTSVGRREHRVVVGRAA
ncbi:MAG: hypothetical protein IPP16_09720 [Acidimicrobiaceae bacterium]|nr:hypothetical protein [Acidimicrobiaceae bacterium]